MIQNMVAFDATNWTYMYLVCSKRKLHTSLVISLNDVHEHEEQTTNAISVSRNDRNAKYISLFLWNRQASKASASDVSCPFIYQVQNIHVTHFIDFYVTLAEQQY